MDLLEASAFPQTLKIVRDMVLADWQANADQEKEETGKDSGEHQNRMKTWWRLKRRRGDLIRSLERKSRYIACPRVTKRPVFAFLDTHFRPDSQLTVFAFQDDYSFGVLQSHAHWTWFTARCSTLKRDWRYTSDTVYSTFPWPQSPTAKQIDAVAEAGREVRRVRSEALKKIKGGLRGLYRTLELPGKNPLRDAHAALDAAVLAAYGFSPKKDLLAQLLALNLDVAGRIERGEAVTAPGVPPGYPDPTRLVTEDCIRP